MSLESRMQMVFYSLFEAGGTRLVQRVGTGQLCSVIRSRESRSKSKVYASELIDHYCAVTSSKNAVLFVCVPLKKTYGFDIAQYIYFVLVDRAGPRLSMSYKHPNALEARKQHHSLHPLRPVFIFSLGCGLPYIIS